MRQTQSLKRQILIICTANICRSPMVAGLIRSRMRAEGRENFIDVVSAGIQAVEGAKASDFTVELLAERGISISQHAAHKLGQSDIDKADIVIVMEESHRRSVFHQSPANLHKVILLSELANQHEDIQDPFGLSKGEYEQAMAKIQTYIDVGWNRLLEKLELDKIDLD